MQSNSNNLNLIRLVLATTVVWSHCFDISRGDGVGDDITNLTKGRISLSFTAVDLFFIISGYLISRSWLSKNDAKQFIQKRVLRIAPAFLASIVFSIFLSLFFLSDPISCYIKYLFSNRFNIFRTVFFFEYPQWLDFPSVFDSNPYPNAVNHSLWTIQYEVICYSFVGVLGAFGLLSRRPAQVIAVIFFLLYVAEFWLSKNPYGSPWRLYCNFFAGVVLNFIEIEKSLSRWKNFVFISMFILIVAAPWNGLFFLCTPVVCGCIVFIVSSLKCLKCEFIQKNDISYGTYVYAMPIQQAVQAVFRFENPYILFVACVPIIYTVGYVSWIFIEQPFLRSKPVRNHGKE